MNESRHYIYSHVRHDTNEVFYVGIGSKSKKHRKRNLFERAKVKLSRNSFWINIFNKTKYSVYILHQNLSWEEACKIEIALIAFHGRRDFGLGTLVNLTNGGEGSPGYLQTEEHKRKISEALKGRPVSRERIEKYLKSRKNFKHTEESRRKMSESLKGRKMSEKLKEIMRKIHTGKKLSKEHIEKLRQYSLGNTIWKGKKHTEETKKKMSEARKGKKMPEEAREKMRQAKLGIPSKNKKPIIQYDKKGNFIQEWESITEAAMQTNSSISKISLVANGLRKSHNKFIWKFKDE